MQEIKNNSVEYFEGKLDAFEKVEEYRKLYHSLVIDMPFNQWLRAMCATEIAYAIHEQTKVLADMEESQKNR